MTGTVSAQPPSRSRLFLASAVVLTLVWQGALVARAQSYIFQVGLSAPVFRGTRGAPHFPQNGGFSAGGLLPKPNLSPLGKPCVEIYPLAATQMINKNIYDHNLLINNQCSQRIRLSVCYYRTRTCSILAIAGYTRQLKLFGIFPEKDFRIEYREYLN